MGKKRDYSGLVVGIYIGLIVLPFVGWGRCIYKFASCDFSNKTSYKAEIVYGVGVFTGTGAILGWFDFGK